LGSRPVADGSTGGLQVGLGSVVIWFVNQSTYCVLI
jgi:hypothetical protein